MKLRSSVTSKVHALRIFGVTSLSVIASTQNRKHVETAKHMFLLSRVCPKIGNTYIGYPPVAFETIRIKGLSPFGNTHSRASTTASGKLSASLNASSVLSWRKTYSPCPFGKIHGVCVCALFSGSPVWLALN